MTMFWAISLMLWPGVATSATPQGACNPKTGDICDFEMDFETSIFIQRQKRATLAGAGTAPALPCSSSLSESTWEKRHKLNSVFFQLYGANMTQSGMAPFEVRPFWPDMSQSGSVKRLKLLKELKEELRMAFEVEGQTLYDKNVLNRMFLIVSERVRGEEIGGLPGVPIALALDLFAQDTTAGSQVPFYYYPGIYQFLTYAQTPSAKKIPEGLASFPQYLQQWTKLLKAAQEANVLPQMANYAVWKDTYLGATDWERSFPGLSEDQELLGALKTSLSEFQAALRALEPFILKAYGPGQEMGYSVLGKFGQEIFLWRLLGWGMDYDADTASQLATQAREGAEEMREWVVRGLSEAFGEEMDVEMALSMIQDQSGPLYYQHTSWDQMTDNLTLVYNNILKNTHLVFGTLSNCNCAVYPCQTLPKDVFGDEPCLANSPFPAFALVFPAFNEHDECVESQYLILGRSADCELNLTKGLACMDYMIPLMTPTMIHEGLGHWVQELQHWPAKCDPDLPAVSTFQEGWGTYAESLGFPLGVYDNSLWGKLSKVGWAMGRGLRMCRFFLEHDVNYKNMSRSEAIKEWNQYPFASPTLYDDNALDFIVNTGQRSTYFPTLQLMMKNRKKAQDSLGSKFSLPLFNKFMGLLTDQLTPAMVGESTEAFIKCSEANNCFG
ncbi:unnamed protein product [Effrenium voratum]|uniref:Angiotensin-converting enzyme n=1 Tax=Effrenium voratum TaxID=2562239 RepID=A0AA36IPN5_9DINO|nr:unnamed protein product [Effrenium voratum]